MKKTSQRCFWNECSKNCPVCKIDPNKVSLAHHWLSPEQTLVVLHKRRIYTVGDVCAKRRSDFEVMEGIGKVALRNLDTILRFYRRWYVPEPQQEFPFRKTKRFPYRN